MRNRTLSIIAICLIAAVAVPGHAAAYRYDEARVKRQIGRAWGGNDDKAIRVADCESSLNPMAASPGGTYLGLWQFSRATWKSYDGPGDDPREVNAFKQTEVAWRLFQDRGWAPWPSCGSELSGTALPDR
jgi:hypothetical protein